MTKAKRHLLWLGAALPLLAISASALGQSRPAPRNAAWDSLCEPEALAALLRSTPTPILIDARDAAAYQAGHLLGAVHAAPAVWKSETLAQDTGLSHEQRWHKRIGELGVSGDAPVIIYDDGRMTEAARVWFVLQHFGVPRVAIVNGGFPALSPRIAAGELRLVTETHAPRPMEFRPRVAGGKIGLIERQRLLRAIQQREVQVLDVRTAQEYSGEDLRKNARGGHLPTAINLPHTQLLTADGRLKDSNTLAQLLAQAGLERGRPIVTHCDGGARAALAALAAERAGYGPVSNYYLSFADWAADAACPVERE